MSQLLKIEQVAEKLNVSTHTVRRWMNKKSIPFTVMPSGTLRFSEKEIDTWITKRTINAKPIGQ